MSKINYLFAWLIFFSLSSTLLAQLDFERKVVQVPKVDPSTMTIDGVMNEAAWQNAGEANLITNAGFEFYGNYYGREVLEPDYEEYYTRMLWSQDTLFLFIHIDEIVNDSSGLYWNGPWIGDQLFVSISNRLGMDLHPDGRYNGNIFTIPDGPFYYLIMGDQLTLNGGNPTAIPDEWQHFEGDTLRTPDPYAFTKFATVIDNVNGVWDIEMAIYNPAVNAQSQLGFNIGGSQGSEAHDVAASDAYAYYCWQPNVPDDPFAEPAVIQTLRDQGLWGDPGTSNLATSQCHAVLEFVGESDVFVRKEVQVPKVDPTTMTIDGVMNEAAWQDAGEANLITNTGFEFYGNYYGREVLEPDYEEYYTRMLWSQDTLFLFIHIDEIVNDSSGLYWNGPWIGDQLFVSLSNRLGMDLHPDGRYNGNIFTVPDGPFYYLILGDQLTLNGGNPTAIPDEWQYFEGDTLRTPDPYAFTKYATAIDYANGVWDIEMAIYNPAITIQSILGFNIGGSQGSEAHDVPNADAYAYYAWQPNVPDDPFAEPAVIQTLRDQGLWGDPGTSNLATSQCHSVLSFVNEIQTGVEDENTNGMPVNFSLDQNYPNPFNPSTTIRINVSEPTPVTLKIYDSIGRLVTTLINNQPLSRGAHLVSWNAKNLSSGIYFYQLEDQNQAQSKKMILLK